MKTIYLPSAEDCNIDIVLNDGSSSPQKVTADLFELEEVFFDAGKEAKESGTHFSDEFPKLFKKKYNVNTKNNITPRQARLLYSAITTNIDSLKKRLLGESENSNGSVPPSSPETTEKPQSSVSSRRRSKRKKR
jgi:hypothetical protein